MIMVTSEHMLGVSRSDDKKMLFPEQQ